jgi:hypothetical protein
VRRRAQASAYNDLRSTPGLGVIVDGRTFFVRDVMLAEMARLTEWVPRKDRVPKARTATPRKKTAAPRRKTRLEVRVP